MVSRPLAMHVLVCVCVCVCVTYHSITVLLHMAMQGVVVVYDITNLESFVNLTKWLDDISEVKYNVNTLSSG